MKECSKCKIVKEFSSFYKNKRYKDELHIYCKECISNCNLLYRTNNKDKESKRKKEYRDLQKSKPIIHHVYLLPNENYVGTTMNVVERMSKHRIVNKRNTNNYRILSSFSNREDALELEELLHNMGYDGKHINNMYK